jgi:hypothetical protein
MGMGGEGRVAGWVDGWWGTQCWVDGGCGGRGWAGMWALDVAGRELMRCGVIYTVYTVAKPLEGSTGQLVNCAVLAAGNKVRMVCSNIRKLGRSC